MKNRIVTCDRCGKVIAQYDDCSRYSFLKRWLGKDVCDGGWHVVTQDQGIFCRRSLTERLMNPIDLCGSCSKEFKTWLKGGKSVD